MSGQWHREPMEVNTSHSPEAGMDFPLPYYNAKDPYQGCSLPDLAFPIPPSPPTLDKQRSLNKSDSNKQTDIIITRQWHAESVSWLLLLSGNVGDVTLCTAFLSQTSRAEIPSFRTAPVKMSFRATH